MYAILRQSSSQQLAILYLGWGKEHAPKRVLETKDEEEIEAGYGMQKPFFVCLFLSFNRTRSNGLFGVVSGNILC